MLTFDVLDQNRVELEASSLYITNTNYYILKMYLIIILLVTFNVTFLYCIVFCTDCNYHKSNIAYDCVHDGPTTFSSVSLISIARLDNCKTLYWGPE